MKKITFLFLTFVLSIGYCQSPTDNATAPPVRDAGDVISIFSGEYANVSGTDYNPNWGQAGFGSANTAFDPGTGDLVLAYPNFNYQGNQFGSTQNISAMEFLHVDIWINGTFNPNVFVISSGAEIAHPVSNTGAQSWISVDIPVAGITGDLSNAIQFKFDGGNGSTDAIYVDNLYFWKNPADPSSDATLSDLQVGGATISGFSSGTTSYTYELVSGSTTPLDITLATTTQAGANAVINQATTVPGDATVVVTASNGTDMVTYTVSFAGTFPTNSISPTVPDGETYSIYNDTNGYSTTFPFAYDFGSVAGEPDVDPSANENKVLKYDFSVAGYGAGEGGPDDISSYGFVSFDYWAVAGVPGFRCEMISNDGGVAGFVYEVGTDEAVVNEAWTKVVIPMSHFTNLGFSATNFFQWKFDPFMQSVAQGGIVYIDNLLVTQGNPLSVNNFEASEFKVFPNPTNNEWNISGNTVINNIAVYDILGKRVISMAPNSTESKIDASTLRTGVYFARIDGANGSKTIKLVRE